MKKKIFLIVSVAVFAAIVVFNVSIALRGDSPSNLTLANIEALVFGETSEEFTRATCCEACICQESCTGCDGRVYSNARKK